MQVQSCITNKCTHTIVTIKNANKHTAAIDHQGTADGGCNMVAATWSVDSNLPIKEDWFPRSKACGAAAGPAQISYQLNY